MRKEILISSSTNEVGVAITEDGRIAEYYIDIPDKERYIGNIYLGRVTKIAQGINAAFIDIGFKHDAFLHFSDIDDSMESNFIVEDDEDDEQVKSILKDITPEEQIDALKDKYIFNNPLLKKQIEGEHPSVFTNGLKLVDEKRQFRQEIPLPEHFAPLKKIKPETISVNTSNNSKKQNQNEPEEITFSTKRSGDIKINLEIGQEIIVQVVREAFSNKGMKVTSRISIAGRYFVLMPFENMIGVSQKINSYMERRKLRSIVREFAPRGIGLIIRTAAKSKTKEEIVNDWEHLSNTWKSIIDKYKYSSAPTLLYKDAEVSNSIIRDLFNHQVYKLHVDSVNLYYNIQNYIRLNSPNLLNRIELYRGKHSIFEEFGVVRDIENIYKRKVMMRSGGSIVIDQTEAMIVIDVNSGKALEKDQEKTALFINLEAVKEIAKQIRLRDFGGIILVDFIDMMLESNKKRLFSELRFELDKDRAKTTIYPLTQLSLMQITRQRMNQNISERISELCTTCEGLGRVRSKGITIREIEDWLRKFKLKSNEFRLLLFVSPEVAAYLSEGTFSRLSKIMLRYFVKIKVLQNDKLSNDKFQFYSVKRQKEITKDF